MSDFKGANLKPVKALIKEKTKDGNLSDSDINDIINQTKSLYKDTPLTRQDILDLQKTVNKELDKSVNKSKKNHISTKIIGVIMIFAWLILLPSIIHAFGYVLEMIKNSSGVLTPTTTVTIILYMVCVFICAALSIITGILMLLNKRAWAGRTLYTEIAITGVLLIIIVSLEGVSDAFFITVASMIVEVIISVFLQPKLYQERKFSRKIQDLDTEERAKSGRLGISVDQTKGYIELDFFNLFWIFVVGSILGLIGEYVFHILFVWGFDPANWYDRAGLLFGPFSQIYGFGALFMTLLLNRLRNVQPVLLFIFTTIIGGAFEYVVSWFMETSFGIKAWDYSGYFLNINGRTCLLFAAIFGVMGFVWIKWALPLFMKLLAKIPWKLRYPITFIFTAFMIVNCIMTLQALDCWSQRQAGKQPVTPIEQFYDKNFGDDFMSKRFASMSFNNENSTRSNLEKASN
ncbi:MAG: putative ABC transporter permease [Coriobacteriia bacterium]|nr:putative ABC transporter permease [Coriobacteriia bacterium]